MAQARRIAKDHLMTLRQSSVARRRNPAHKFNVYLRGKLIDSVFSTETSTAEMKRSLVNHDGYDPGIRVTRSQQYDRTYRGQTQLARDYSRKLSNPCRSNSKKIVIYIGRNYFNGSYLVSAMINGYREKLIVYGSKREAVREFRKHFKI
jgi:hypothetical protein